MSTCWKNPRWCNSAERGSRCQQETPCLIVSKEARWVPPSFFFFFFCDLHLKLLESRWSHFCQILTAGKLKRKDSRSYLPLILAVTETLWLLGTRTYSKNFCWGVSQLHLAQVDSTVCLASKSFYLLSLPSCNVYNLNDKTLLLQKKVLWGVP